MQQVKPSIIYECPICKKQIFYMLTRTMTVKHFHECYQAYIMERREN